MTDEEFWELIPPPPKMPRDWEIAYAFLRQNPNFAIRPMLLDVGFGPTPVTGEQVKAIVISGKEMYEAYHAKNRAAYEAAARKIFPCEHNN